MNLADCYTLAEKTVDARHLMLDPNNPRLSLEWNAGENYSNAQLCSQEIQDKVFRSVLAGKHRVNRLILSLTEKGFVRGSQPMIVKHIGTGSKYLVLEGNRRTAAIRHLLSDGQKLGSQIINSIRSVPVQVFEYIKNSRFDEEEVIDVLLGTIHIEGPQEWGAMEKAYYIYRGYARELKRIRNAKTFRYDAVVAKTVGKHYSMTAGSIKKTLGIYRVFQQLRNDRYDVNAEDYSLIEMAISKRPTQEFFEYDPELLKLTPAGLEDFSVACLERDAPIKNPPGFNAFAYVIQNGTEYEVRQVLDERRDPHDVKARTRQRVQKRVFVERLESIKQDIDRLKPTEFRGTQEEMRLIKQVSSLVDDKLLKLIPSNGAKTAKRKKRKSPSAHLR